MTEDLVFADERCARDLRDHEARVQTALGTHGREKRRKAGGERWVDELFDPSLADVRELGGGHGREIERQSEGLAMEIASTQDLGLASIDEDARIVRDAVHFAFENGPDPRQGVARR